MSLPKQEKLFRSMARLSSVALTTEDPENNFAPTYREAFHLPFSRGVRHSSLTEAPLTLARRLAAYYDSLLRSKVTAWGAKSS